MVSAPRLLLLGTAGVLAAVLAFFIGAHAGTTLSRVMTNATPAAAAALVR
jgi:hypothetical protein